MKESEIRAGFTIVFLVPEKTKRRMTVTVGLSN